MRILLVEDEEKVRRFIVRGLKAEGYAVDAAVDGQEGLGHLSGTSYDLVALDINLPGLSGTDLLQRLRKDNSTVPVLMLTARDSVADKVKNFECGADDYLTKPFSFAELLVRVKALLRRGPVERASVLRVSDLELDRVAHQVRRQEKTID